MAQQLRATTTTAAAGAATIESSPNIQFIQISNWGDVLGDERWGG